MDTLEPFIVGLTLYIYLIDLGITAGLYLRVIYISLILVTISPTFY